MPENITGEKSLNRIPDSTLTDIPRLQVLSEVLRRVHDDPVAREAVIAGARTLINLGVGVGDLGPIILGILGSFAPVVGNVVGGGLGTVGEASSWLADALKVTSRGVFLITAGKVRLPDLTPDVSMKSAVGSEVLEIAGFSVPTHLLFEFRTQFSADKPRMEQALMQARERIALKQLSDQTREATSAFGVQIDEQ